MSKMSKKIKDEAVAVIAAVPEVAEAPKAEATPEQRVYCGPTINGVARSFQCFTGGIPASLNRMVEDNPVVGALIVTTDEMPEAWGSIRSGKGKYAALYNAVLKK